MLKYWIWLSTRQNVSGAQAIVLLSRFGSAVAIYQADEEALKRGSDASVPPSLLDKSLTGAEVILQQCYQKNIHVMTIQDAQYPARLRTIDDPPIVLYYKGVFPAIDTSPVIAMVGTRKASAYGLMQAKRLGYQVAKCGGMVVSGGAEGIDTMCLTGRAEREPSGDCGPRRRCGRGLSREQPDAFRGYRVPRLPHQRISAADAGARLAFPGAQPDYQRAFPRRCGRGSAEALGRTDYGKPRVRAGKRRLYRAR